MLGVDYPTKSCAIRLPNSVIVRVCGRQNVAYPLGLRKRGLFPIFLGRQNNSSLAPFSFSLRILVNKLCFFDFRLIQI
jgi:hypothetical protein